MNKPPFSLPPVELLQQLASRLPAPPAWLRAELHNRLVLLLNHVLQQEPQAMDRLRRQQGKRLQLSWGSIELVLQPTPAGLLALSQPDQSSDLQLRVAETSPLALAQTLLAGGKPPVEIQGDVQLAAMSVLGLRLSANAEAARFLRQLRAAPVNARSPALKAKKRRLAESLLF